jgi:hypothetical protein
MPDMMGFTNSVGSSMHYRCHACKRVWSVFSYNSAPTMYDKHGTDISAPTPPPIVNEITTQPWPLEVNRKIDGDRSSGTG